MSRKHEVFPSTIAGQQARLRAISAAIAAGRELYVSEKDFLVQSLKAIADGQDANTVLGVASKRGRRKSRKAAEALFVRELDMAWIRAAMQPVSKGGLGLTLDDAIRELASDELGLPSGRTYETLLQIWKKEPKLRKSVALLPLELYPDERLIELVSEPAGGSEI